MVVKAGFFGIGITHVKNATNIGSLWRTAHLLRADFVFTIGRRYKDQASDTTKATRHIPCWHFDSLAALLSYAPKDAPLVGVELDSRAESVTGFRHPRSAIYLLGAEDHGLTNEERERCHKLIVLPGERSMNVAVAGSIVMFDRWQKARERAMAVAAE